MVFGACDQPFVDQKPRAMYSLCHPCLKILLLRLHDEGGGSFKWMRDTLFADKKQELAEKGGDVYAYVDALAGGGACRQRGPVLSAPILAASPRLMWTPTPEECFGLSYRHNLGAMCRSVMEGVTFSCGIFWKLSTKPTT